MAKKALFAGLVVDEQDRPVGVSTIGEDACYVVDDGGFRRHIDSEDVDRQVLLRMKEQIQGNEDAISEQTAKMMGQDDIFTRALLMQQLKQIDQQFETLLETGIPEDARAYLGMMGFKVVINVHGEVIEFSQPGRAADEGEE